MCIQRTEEGWQVARGFQEATGRCSICGHEVAEYWDGFGLSSGNEEGNVEVCALCGLVHLPRLIANAIPLVYDEANLDWAVNVIESQFKHAIRCRRERMERDAQRSGKQRIGK